MLSEFRTSVAGLGAKFLLAFLVLSFAIWGIGDMVRAPAHNRAVVTVGEVSVMVPEFQQAVQREENTLRQALGDQATPEMVVMLHPERRALQTLITRYLLQAETKALGLIPGDADVVRRVRNNVNFHDGQGNFDKATFERILQRARISEKAYLDSLREDIASELLINTITNVAYVSDAAVSGLYAAREEKRLTTLYRFNDAIVGALPSPEAGVLETYFSQHQSDFSAPEYRNVSYAVLTPDLVREKAAVSEETLLAAYKDHIDEFRRPERRAVDQLLFSNEKDARQAEADIEAGADFDSVAKKAPIMNKGSISLGTIERSHIIDAAAESVFTSPAGTVTPAIQSPFGWHIFRVRSIEPPSVTPLSEVRESLKKEVEQHLREDAYTKLMQHVEDAVAGGAPLQEAAKEFGIAVKSLGPVTQAGNSPDGTALALPKLDRFLEVAFKTEDKRESPLIDTGNGSYYMLRVDSVTPERQRSLDEVRGLATNAWQEEERARRMQDMAQEITGAMKDSAKRETAIGKYRLSAFYNGSVKRGSKEVNKTPLPQGLVADIFGQPPQGATAAYPLSATEYVIAVAGKTVPAPPIDEKSRAAIQQELAVNVRRELTNEYLAYLESKYPVTINEELVASFTGQ